MSSPKLEPVALLLNTAVTRLGRRIRHIDDRQDIGRARLSALSVLVFGGARSMSELAAEEMVSMPTIHHVVRGLVDLNLARTRKDPADARRTIVTASVTGKRFMEEARRCRLEFYEQRLADLSEKDRRVVERFSEIALTWLE